MRKPSKKGVKPEQSDSFPAGRAWERIEQFRISRGLEAPPKPAGAKPVKKAKTIQPIKPKPGKPR